ncbi:dioxygenase [Deltaproteobacteria bacterium]|nr:dioxygenase [Deltaproteobacteria bacterium]
MYWKNIFKLRILLYQAMVIAWAALLPVHAQHSTLPSSSGSALIISENTLTPSLLPDDIPAVCPRNFVDQQTEGPYYKTGSPERTDLIEEGVAGEPVILTGYVFDKDCNPVPGAWLDFWQADGNGDYDNRGYMLRGHQYTDQQGKYILRTVIPGEYPGRTNHIHLKVRGQTGDAIITSQLYFPAGRLNKSDRIFDESMLVTLSKSSDGRNMAFFNFRLN